MTNEQFGVILEDIGEAILAFKDDIGEGLPVECKEERQNILGGTFTVVPTLDPLTNYADRLRERGIRLQGRTS